MPIIKVTSIPTASHTPPEDPFNYRDAIREDLKEAIEKRIEMFELVGYPNTNYVTSSAKVVAFKYLSEIVFIPAKDNVKKKLSKEFKKELGGAVKYIRPNIPKTNTKAIEFRGVTVRGVKRAYAKIDFDYIDNFEKNLLDQTRTYYSDPDIQASLKKRWDREKVSPLA